MTVLGSAGFERISPSLLSSPGHTAPRHHVFGKLDHRVGSFDALTPAQNLLAMETSGETILQSGHGHLGHRLWV